MSAALAGAPPPSAGVPAANPAFAAAPRQGQLSNPVSVLMLAPLLLLLGWTFFLPIIRLLATSVTEPSPNIANYVRLVTEPLYAQVILRTIWIAFTCTVLALLLGYPVAALMARPGSRTTRIATICVLVPLWTSALVRSYAWIIMLERNGVINSTLLSWGMIGAPLRMLYTNGAVLMAMTQVLLPFMILPIFTALKSLPPELPRAAANLGAGRMRVFLSVTLPLSLPGVFAGCLLVFVMALGFYITPALVGGPQTLMIATLIGQQATEMLNWPFAGAISCVLLVLSLGITFTFKRLLRLERVVSHD